MIGFRKVVIFSIIVLIFSVVLSGCLRVSHSTDLGKSETEKISSSSSDQEIEDAQTTPSPSTTPLTYNIHSLETNQVLGIYPANDAVVIIGIDSRLTIVGEIFEDIVDLERRGRIEYAANMVSVGLLFQNRGGYSDVLVFSDGNEAIDVANDVLDFHVSYDGKRIAYRVRTNEYDPTVSAHQYDTVIDGFYDASIGALYVYDAESKESILISEYAGEQYTLSSFGRALAYMCIFDYEKPEDWRLLYGVIEDEFIDTGRKEYPVALTDDISLVYVMQRDSTKLSFYVYHQGIRTLLDSDLVYLGNRMFIFNEDCTEVLINTEEGVLYYSQGDEAYLIESSFAVYSEQEFASKSDIFKSILQSNQLGNNLFIISSDFGFSKTLWLFRDDGTAIQLISIAEGMWNSDCAYKRVDSTVLFGNSEELIFADNINDPANMQLMPIESVSTQEYLLTSNHSVYYYSADETTKSDYSAGLERYGARLFEMSVLYSESRESPVVISSSCVYMERQTRENQPDIIYYLEYVEPETSNDEYTAWRYNALYAIEDVPGAESVLITDNVSEIGIGDFGVFFARLSRAGSGTLDWFANSIDAGYLRDTVDIYYSSDGQDFERISTVGREYLIWSGS